MSIYRHITADLNYLDTEFFTTKNRDSKVQYKPGEYYGYEPSEENDKLISELTGANAARNVIIRDVRCLSLYEQPRMDEHGFELISDDLGSIACNLYNAFDLTIEHSQPYVNEIEKMVTSIVEKRLTLKVKLVSVFDLAKRKSKSSDSNEIPLSFIHSDYTRSSGVERLQQQVISNKDSLAPVSFKPLRNRFENEEELENYTNGKCRFLIVNLWRNADPNKFPISQDPLAVCDPRSIPNESLVNYEIRCSDGLSLYEYHVSGGKSDNDCKHHKWYYYSGMTVDECLIWISYDKDGTFSSVPHTAFSLPQNESRERKSIEARAFVFLEP